MTSTDIFPLNFSVSGYRCFVAPLPIQLARTTVITGHNNSGKSTVLRAIAILLNSGKEGKFFKENDLPTGQTSATFTIDVPLSSEAIQQLLPLSQPLAGALSGSSATSLPIVLKIGPNGRVIDPAAMATAWGASGLSKQVLRDASLQIAGSNHSEAILNIAQIAQRILDGLSLYRGTTFLPSIRYVLKPNTSPVNFTETSMPGKMLSPEGIVSLLHSLDRPKEHEQKLKERIRNIEDFIAYCLSRKSVRLEVASDQSQILVDIDGTIRSLANLGTGIEQLVMIGTAALGTEKDVVLLEEPELHLHPTTQRRMVEYISRTDVTLVMTTHSACMLDAGPAALLHLRGNGSASVGELLKSDQARFDSVIELGYRASDLAQSNFVIWVEGPSDRIYLDRWIKLTDPDLVENIDYTICFYGGRLLSHISVDGAESATKFISVLSVNRNCAILIDSDKSGDADILNPTKRRIIDECSRSGAFCWVTMGREIENYADPDSLIIASKTVRGVQSSWSQYDRVYESDTVDKMRLAQVITDNTQAIPDVLDLRKAVGRLVRAIASIRIWGGRVQSSRVGTEQMEEVCPPLLPD